MKVLLATFAVSLSMITVPPVSAGGISPPDYTFPRGLPHAPYDSECYSHRCVWDARHQGNGEGQSMILTRWKGGFVARPISHRRAHRLQAAYCERRSVTCEGYTD